MEDLLSQITARAIDGAGASVDQALRLAEMYPLHELQQAADKVRLHWCGSDIDTCAIVNARSGSCPENCRWCAQSAHWHTNAGQYDVVDRSHMLDLLSRSTARGVGRFSLVTSGRSVLPKHIGLFCDLFKACRAHSPIGLCASMGLLGPDEFDALREAGVTRYHCNLETSASYFSELCTTHTRADKLRTINAALAAGLEICSGGIIGMGESRRQRLELAQECRDAGACSIPVNILCPIPGTPLADTPALTESEIELTGALYRLIAPKTTIRFAGGRAKLSREATARMLRGGVNGAMVGDLLTTNGPAPDTDRKLFGECGYTWDNPYNPHPHTDSPS